MDERTAAQLSEWAEREMALAPNSASALRGASAAEFGHTALDEALDEPHVPAEPDPGIGEQLDRARRGIAGEDARG